MKQTEFVVIIPARYQSVRFPGKPLAGLTGTSGESKSLIQRSWECARSVAPAANIWVATDDERIAGAVEAFGGQVVMTSSGCRNGTERCAEAVERLAADMPCDIVVNLQGDAPLTPSEAVRAIVEALATDESAAMATAVMRCTPDMLRHLIEDEAAGRVGGTTAVSALDGRALYFSKRIIPHISCEQRDMSNGPVDLHLGLYAYRRAALRRYAGRTPGELEIQEGLEQLRFLEAGERVLAVRIQPVAWPCVELNNPTDRAAIEAVLGSRGIV